MLGFKAVSSCDPRKLRIGVVAADAGWLEDGVCDRSCNKST